MELPRRARGDELLRPGELAGIWLRLRNLAPKHDARVSSLPRARSADRLIRHPLFVTFSRYSPIAFAHTDRLNR
jgi:hypothetical protein